MDVWNYATDGLIWHLGLGSSEIIRAHLGSSGIIWDHLGSSAIIWDHLSSSGIIWAHLGLLKAFGSKNCNTS